MRMRMSSALRRRTRSARFGFAVSTEQIISQSDGGDLKPITQNEGAIYFICRVATAPRDDAGATIREWQFGQIG